MGEVVPVGYERPDASGRKRVIVPNGSFMESGVHASQQDAGLHSLELDEEARHRIRKLGFDASKWVAASFI